MPQNEHMTQLHTVQAAPHARAAVRLGPSTAWGSSITGCSFTDTRSHAIDVASRHSISLADNVVYNTTGHAFHIHPPAHAQNAATAVVAGNVAMGVRASSSGLPSDLTPAAFHIAHSQAVVRWVRRQRSHATSMHDAWQDAQMESTRTCWSYVLGSQPEIDVLTCFARTISCFLDVFFFCLAPCSFIALPLSLPVLQQASS